MASMVSKTVRPGCYLLLLMLTIQPVLAQSNVQGLEWGFEVGDVFEYDWTVYDELAIWPDVLELSERILVEIKSLPEIPANVDSLDDIFSVPTGFTETHFKNGTAVPDSVPWVVMPVGNWPLVATLLLESFQAYVYEHANVSLTATVCFVEVDTSSAYSAKGNATMELLLSSGVVSYLETKMVYSDFYTEEEMVTSAKLVLVPASPIPVLVTIMLGGSMVAAILAVEIHRRRRTTIG